MPITVNDFPSLTDNLQELFVERAKRKVAESTGFELFDVKDTERRTFDHLVLHGVSGIQEVTPGQDLPSLTTEEGDSITWTQRYFGALAIVTKAMRKFDLYNQIESQVTSLVDDAFDKVDQSLADYLSQGWSTSHTDVYGKTISTVGPDGLQLFSASHSNPLSTSVYSNIISDGTNSNPHLSREAIVYQLAQGLVHTDPNGLIRPIRYDLLIVPPALEDLARRLVETERLPGSANNDRNPLYGRLKVVVWARLQTSADGTDRSTYWYMADSTGIKETLKCLFAERPSLDPPETVYANKNWEFSCDFFYTNGIGYQAYVAGSQGDDT